MWPAPTDFSLKEGTDILSPKEWLELDRPGAGIANAAGDLIFLSVSRYSFEGKKDSTFLFITSIQAPQRSLEIPLPDGGTVFWLNDRTIAHVVVDGDEKDKPPTLRALFIKYDHSALALVGEPSRIGVFPAASGATNFKYSSKPSTLVFSAYVYADGDINAVKANDEAWENRGDSAYVYDETYTRHWDHWIGPKRSSLFAVRLAKVEGDKWELGSDYTNLLQGTGHHCPVEPFGGLGDFDVSEEYVVYTALDPSLPPAWHTRTGIHLVRVDGSSKPRELTTGKQGATNNPVFNQQGNQIAWLQRDRDGAEADRAKIVIYDLETNVRFTLTQHWDRSPETTLSFSPDGHAIIFTAGDQARRKIFAIPVPPTPKQSTEDPDLPAVYRTPHALTQDGSVSSVQPLANGRLLFTRESCVAPPEVYLLEGLDKLDLLAATVPAQLPLTIEQLTNFVGDRLSGKDLRGGEDFWFEGAEGVQVHGFVYTPAGFKQGEKKKWPALVIVHGGPQYAWFDEWLSIGNPIVYAHQGYVVVAINYTGSTTFGQAFTDAITEDWGGRPFVDLQRGWAHILSKYPEIDPDRAVAAGMSWGGFAMNTIQGHPEYGFNFKALVSHAGIFSTESQGYTTDELFYFNHEWGGRPWEPRAQELLKKYDPSKFVEKWKTPMLITHGSNDHRIPETESIAAFHALQQLGVQSRLVIFPDEGHPIFGPQNQLKWHWEAFRWFDKFVGSKE